MFTKEQEQAKRLRITLPPKQKEWLINFCKNHNITPSKYISWMLSKKAEEMIQVLRIDYTNYDDEELREIIKYKWVDVN